MVSCELVDSGDCDRMQGVKRVRRILIGMAVVTLLGCVSSRKEMVEIAGHYMLPRPHAEVILSLKSSGKYELRHIPFAELDEKEHREAGVWSLKATQVRLHPAANSYRTVFNGLRVLDYRPGRVSPLLTAGLEGEGVARVVFNKTAHDGPDGSSFERAVPLQSSENENPSEEIERILRERFPGASLLIVSRKEGTKEHLVAGEQTVHGGHTYTVWHVLYGHHVERLLYFRHRD